MQPEEVLETFGAAMIDGLRNASQTLHQPRTMLLAIHSIQAALEPLATEAVLAPATVRILARLGELARGELELIARADQEADERLQAEIRRSRGPLAD